MRKIFDLLEALPRTSFSEAGEGWINMANLGTALRDNGIDFRAKGYERLGDYLESTRQFEFYYDKTGDIPVKYVREKKVSPSGTKMTGAFRFALMTWAHIQIPAKIKELAELALPEFWGPRLCYLVNYLKYTFAKLMKEGKILYSPDGQYAAFNTGLVNRLYLPIYALFKKNTLDYVDQEWFLVKFTVEGSGVAGKTLSRLFDPLPERAQYIRHVSDVLYDTSKRMSVDYEHIIIDRIDRMPAELIEENCPAGFDVLRLDAASVVERENAFADLRKAIIADQRCFRQLRKRLDEAIDLALVKTQWNYKTALPSYYPPEDKVTLLLPLSLVDEERVDNALVVSKSSETGNYQAETILSLTMAYMDARLVARPDSYWLSNVSSEETTLPDEEN